MDYSLIQPPGWGDREGLACSIGIDRGVCRPLSQTICAASPRAAQGPAPEGQGAGRVPPQGPRVTPADASPGPAQVVPVGPDPPLEIVPEHALSWEVPGGRVGRLPKIHFLPPWEMGSPHLCTP